MTLGISGEILRQIVVHEADLDDRNSIRQRLVLAMD
jgi:hypothetical protein